MFVFVFVLYVLEYETAGSVGVVESSWLWYFNASPSQLCVACPSARSSFREDEKQLSALINFFILSFDPDFNFHFNASPSQLCVACLSARSSFRENEKQLSALYTGSAKVICDTTDLQLG